MAGIMSIKIQMIPPLPPMIEESFSFFCYSIGEQLTQIVLGTVR